MIGPNKVLVMLVGLDMVSIAAVNPAVLYDPGTASAAEAALNATAFGKICVGGPLKIDSIWG